MGIAAQIPARLKYLALGDSYSIGEGVSKDQRWPNQLVDILNAEGFQIDSPEIIATTGWRTDNLINAIQISHRKPVYDLVSLLIGVNNQYQGKSIDQFRVDLVRLGEMAVQLAKNKKENVFVVSIPDYGYTPYGFKSKDKISSELNVFNDYISQFCKSKGIAFINITDISREGLEDPSLLAPDGLHPSGKMYNRWAVRIASQIKNLLVA
ncbi:MAG TPA: lysophospholipase [Cytophagales bacterium]|jgi:acyl-CoA thioesterase I|nr:lysophospholipase [Cytophagales bacterium]